MVSNGERKALAYLLFYIKHFSTGNIYLFLFLFFPFSVFWPQKKEFQDNFPSTTGSYIRVLIVDRSFS
jgi:hypothetical protein